MHSKIRTSASRFNIILVFWALGRRVFRLGALHCFAPWRAAPAPPRPLVVVAAVSRGYKLETIMLVPLHTKRRPGTTSGVMMVITRALAEGPRSSHRYTRPAIPS